MPGPIVFYLGFLLSNYIDQSKFELPPVCIKSRVGAIYSTRASTEWEAISEKGSFTEGKR